MKLKLFTVSYIFLSFFVLSCSASEKAAQTEQFRIFAQTALDKKYFDSSSALTIAKKMVTNASVLQQQGNYAEAIIEFQEALRLDSTASICFAIAQSYHLIDKDIPSLEYCYKAVRLDSTFMPAYELLYNIYYNSKYYNEAIIVSEQILHLDPSRDNKIKYAILKSIDNPKESITILEALLSDSTDNELMFLLSSAYEQDKQFDKMLILLEKLFENQPSNFEVANGLLEFYSDQNQFDKALTVLDKSDKFFDTQQNLNIYNTFGSKLIFSQNDSTKQFFKSYLNRIDERFYFEWVTQAIAGKLNSLIKDSNETIKFYNRAFSLADTSSFLYIDAAISFSNLKMYDSSLQYLIIGKNKFPNDSRFDFYICNAYMLMKNYEKALYYSTILIESDSSNVLFLTTQAGILQEMKRFEESDYLYEKSLLLDPMDASTSNNYAYSLSIRGDRLNKALKLSTFAIESEPDNVAYLDTYAWIHYQMGNYEKALEFILKASGSSDVSAEVFEHLGDIYSKMNKIDSALESYQKSLDLESNSESVINKIKLIKK
jgi:tetratricopeptide (TPR) repeat protein